MELSKAEADPQESGVDLGVDLGTMDLETGPIRVSLVISESMTMEKVFELQSSVSSVCRHLEMCHPRA